MNEVNFKPMSKSVKKILTWGSNISGALGRGELGAISVQTPGFVPTPLDDPPVQVAAGWGHTAFITRTGKAVMCGRSFDMRNTLRFGKLSVSQPLWASIWTKYLGGLGSIDFPEPTAVTGSMKCSFVTASAGLTVGITREGTGFAMGANRYGQTGIEDVSDDRPVFVPSPIKFPQDCSRLVSIAAGHQNVCAVDESGEIYSWGKGNRGQTGRGEAGVKESPTRLPTRIERFAVDGIAAVSSGFSHCLALSKSGTVYAWGKHQANDGKDAITPIPVSGLPPIVEIACGQYHSVARDASGNVFQWGLLPSELGSRFISQPQRVSGVPPTATSLACGFTETAIINNGEVYSWDWRDLRARPVQSLENFHVEQMAFGWQHKAVLVRA